MRAAIVLQKEHKSQLKVQLAGYTNGMQDGNMRRKVHINRYI